MEAKPNASPKRGISLHETQLPQQLKERRAQHGLSQDELARAIYVSRQTISNWETGKTYPDVDSLLLLSKVLDASIDELIQGDVAIMRRAMRDDARKMTWLGWGTLIAALLGIVFLLGLSAAWTDPAEIGNLSKGTVAGLAVFMPLYALGLGMALAVERIKKRYDIVTYRDLVAFSQGGDEALARDDEGFSRAHPALSIAMKLLLSAAAGAGFGILAYKLIG